MNAIVTSEFNGKRLMLAREIQNISGPKLAEKIGVTKQTISQYENGIISPSPENVMMIAKEMKKLLTRALHIVAQQQQLHGM